MTDESLLARVATIVSGHAGGMTIEPDTPFLLAGYVDSFALIQMVGTLEERFGITIAAEALTQENFATVTAIAALIERGGV